MLRYYKFWPENIIHKKAKYATTASCTSIFLVYVIPAACGSVNRIVNIAMLDSKYRSLNIVSRKFVIFSGRLNRTEQTVPMHCVFWFWGSGSVLSQIYCLTVCRKHSGPFPFDLRSIKLKDHRKYDIVFKNWLMKKIICFIEETFKMTLCPTITDNIKQQAAQKICQMSNFLYRYW